MATDTVDGFLDGLVIDHASSVADAIDQEKRTARLASTIVRKHTQAHPCAGILCRHRNHRRDGYHADLLLEALNLPGEPALPGDYDGDVTFHTLSKYEIEMLRGSAGRHDG